MDGLVAPVVHANSGSTAVDSNSSLKSSLLNVQPVKMSIILSDDLNMTGCMANCDVDVVCPKSPLIEHNAFSSSTSAAGFIVTAQSGLFIFLVRGRVSRDPLGRPRRRRIGTFSWKIKAGSSTMLLRGSAAKFRIGYLRDAAHYLDGRCI